LKASQNRMKREALSEALTSRTPPPNCGLLAMTPTVWPMMRMKQTNMFFAQLAWGSKNTPLSATAATTFFMS